MTLSSTCLLSKFFSFSFMLLPFGEIKMNIFGRIQFALHESLKLPANIARLQWFRIVRWKLHRNGGVLRFISRLGRASCRSSSWERFWDVDKLMTWYESRVDERWRRTSPSITFPSTVSSAWFVYALTSRQNTHARTHAHDDRCVDDPDERYHSKCLALINFDPQSIQNLYTKEFIDCNRLLHA